MSRKKNFAVSKNRVIFFFLLRAIDLDWLAAAVHRDLFCSTYSSWSSKTGGAKRQVCAWTGPDRDLNAQAQVLPEVASIKILCQLLYF